MANTISISVPDIATKIATYVVTTGVIRVHRATSKNGSYSSLTTIALVTDQTYYEYDDTSGGASHWYKYRFENAAATTVSEWSLPFPGRSPITRTRQQVRQEVAKEMGMYESGTLTTVTSSASAADSSKISTLLSTDAYRAHWIKNTSGATDGQTRRVGAFTVATRAFAITPVFSASPTADSTYELYRDCHPDDIDDAINDALEVLTYREEFRFSAEQHKTIYAMPYWLASPQDILSMEQLYSWGETTGEGENERWAPVSGGYTPQEVAGEIIIHFWGAPSENSVFRVWALKSHVATAEDRLTADTDTTFAPLQDLVVGAQVGVYKKLRNATPNQATHAWDKRHTELAAEWAAISRRQHVWRSVAVRGLTQEQWA